VLINQTIFLVLGRSFERNMTIRAERKIVGPDLPMEVKQKMKNVWIHVTKVRVPHGGDTAGRDWIF